MTDAESEPLYLDDYPTRQRNYVLAEPVIERLNDLYETVRNGGIPTSRKEIVAAAVMRLTTDPEGLAEVIAHYRMITHQEIEVDLPEE